MTTRFDFVPSNSAPFQFQPELDGATYTCVVTWNLFGRRYYLSCYDLAGVRIFTTAMVGSPGGLPLESLEWADGVARATTLEDHGYPVGSTIRFSISGSNPAAYDGTVDALIVSEDAFTFPLTADPGATVAPGAFSRDLDLAGDFFESKIVYREPARQFEVSP